MVNKPVWKDYFGRPEAKKRYTEDMAAYNAKVKPAKETKITKKAPIKAPPKEKVVKKKPEKDLESLKKKYETQAELAAIMSEKKKAKAEKINSKLVQSFD
jgi:hypothetical protein